NPRPPPRPGSVPAPAPPPLPKLPAPRVREEPEKTKSRALPILVTLLVGCGAAAGIYYLQHPVASEPRPSAPPVLETKKQEPLPKLKPVETPVNRPPLASKVIAPEKP